MMVVVFDHRANELGKKHLNIVREQASLLMVIFVVEKDTSCRSISIILLGLA